MSERATISSRTLFWSLAGSLVLALGVGFFIYLKYVRYEPIAERHIPAGAAVSVTLEVEQAVAYEPFRRHILSLVEAGRRDREPRILHLERKTTLELGVDTREVVFSFFGDGELVAAVGGLFRRDGVVEGAARLLTDERTSAKVLEAPQRLVVAAGQTFGQAADGVLLVATSERAFRTALPVRNISSPSKRNRPVLRLGSGTSFPPVALENGALLTGVRLEIAAGRSASDPPFVLMGELTFDGPSPAVSDFSHLPVVAALGVKRLVPGAPGQLTLEGELSREGFDQLVAEVGSRVALALQLP